MFVRAAMTGMAVLMLMGTVVSFGQRAAVDPAESGTSAVSKEEPVADVGPDAKAKTVVQYGPKVTYPCPEDRYCLYIDSNDNQYKAGIYATKCAGWAGSLGWRFHGYMSLDGHPACIVQKPVRAGLGDKTRELCPETAEYCRHISWDDLRRDGRPAPRKADLNKYKVSAYTGACARFAKNLGWEFEGYAGGRKPGCWVRKPL